MKHIDFQSMKEGGESDEANWLWVNLGELWVRWSKLTMSQWWRVVSPMKQTDYDSMKESGESDEAKSLRVNEGEW